MTAKKLKQPVDQAVTVLREGGVIAYATEAVYGLGCDPQQLSAVERILQLKQRDKSKGLILVAASLEQFAPYIQPLSEPVKNKLLHAWQQQDKAITWLVPARESVSEYLRGQYSSIAIRVSHHPQVKQLCQQFNGAIVSTSANISSNEPARTAAEVKAIFNNDIDYILEGSTNPDASPSEIRDAISDKVIRQS